MEPLKLRVIKNEILKNDPLFNCDEFQEIDLPLGEYYFMSNDQVDTKMNSTINQPYTFIGIANPHSLHVIGALSNQVSINRIILIDSNYEQLLHFLKLTKNIINSENRIDYLQKTFKVHFNEYGTEILNNTHGTSPYFIRGAAGPDGLEQIEILLWKNLTFDKKAFEQDYNLKVNGVENGIRVDTKTIGDINEYYITLVSSSTALYKSHPFSAGYGCGFLYDETVFKKLRNKLINTPISLIYGDIASVLDDILMACRYDPIILWTSNVYSDYFMKKNDNLKVSLDNIIKKGTQKEPDFPEIDMVLFQDLRTATKLPRQLNPYRFWRNRKLSVHTRTFRIVSKYLFGRNGLEIVNMQSWIDQDDNISKLPNLMYMHSKKFSSLPTSMRYDTIFLHILVGHGMALDEYCSLLQKASKMCQRLIILEHNKESNEFRKRNVGIRASDIREVLGDEDQIEYISGDKSNDRNVLMIYGQK